MLEQALRRALPAGVVAGLPGMVETCHWHGCEEPAPTGPREVVMAAPPSVQWYKLDHVALCTQHLVRFENTGALTLKYHPAEGRGARRVSPPFGG